ncbi:MAG: hypothetical protein KC414_13875 [Romboutsia sp.]|nr:hypothetical protein [Romboutsia sp.]
MDNTNRYDLGNSDSLYFKDKNKECTETKVETYCDCNDNPFCITKEEYLPYIQEYEILAPVFISTTWGSEKFFKSIIRKEAEKIKGKTFIHINRPLQVGEIIKIEGDCCAKYFIKSKLKKRDEFGNFIIQIERLDGYSIVYLDLDKFKENKKIIVTGYFKEHKCFQNQ